MATTIYLFDRLVKRRLYFMEEICWSTEMFGKNSSDYHELNAGAHRNTPKTLYAPALTWHLAFWINQQQNRDHVRKELDNYLLTLCKALKDDNSIKKLRLHPRVPNKFGKKYFLLFKLVADADFRLIDSPDLTGDLTERQRDIWESSSRAVSVEFKWHGICLSIRCEFHREYFSMTTFAELEKDRDRPFYNCVNLDDARAYFKGDKNGIEADSNQHFFRDFWDSYYSGHILANPAVKALWKDKDSIFDRVFADFRGIVLSEKAVELPSDNEFFDGNELPSWGKDARKKFFPLLNAHTTDRLRQYECSVSYMLDGRAMYMSALAPQLPDSPDSERIPLEFIVYAHQHVPKNAKRESVNKWELGRLVNHLHRLGILRLAALKDVKLLHDVGRQLSKLDPIIEGARKSIADEPNAMKSIKTAHNDCNDITADFIKKANCDLAYRIERSRYYVDQVRSNVEFLRIKELEGYQPYDQFVERRLGGEFDFIDRLGRRYERAKNDISMLDQNYLSIETAQIDADTKLIDAGIHKIQEAGELALLAVLVPYYVSHLLAQFLPESLVPILTILTWTLCAAWAVSRFSRNYVSRVGAWCIGLYSGLFSGLFIVLLFVKFVSLGWNTSIFPRFPDTPRDQLEVERDLLAAQKEHDTKLLETQTKQLNVQKSLLDALNAEREKKTEDAPPRLRPKHQNRQLQRVAQ